MILPVQYRVGAAICRSLFTTSLLATAVALRAQQADVDKPKHDLASPHHTASTGDATTCIQEAAKMNMATIAFGQLGSQKAENAELKRFSQTLQSDHKKAQAKLETVAQKHNITLPTALDAKCQEEMAKLQNLSGAEFDKEFARGAVEGHAMAVAHLSQASMEAKDPDVAQYAKDTLARVKVHQVEAREVAKAVGLDAATIASLESKAKEGVGSSGATTESSGATSSTKDSDQKNPAPPRQP